MIRKFNEKFYKCSTKITQDNFILKFCSVQGAKRLKNESKRTKAVKYYILGDKGVKVPVCQKTFMGALLVKKDRIQGVLKRFYEGGGQMPQENRGGDRKSEKFTIRKLSVQRFIESFKGQESHYCRSKNMNRLYLSPELNIRKMWRMYNQSYEQDLQVKQHFFRKIFNQNYNIGFGTPRTDVCSTCTEIGERLKVETDTTKKNHYIIEKRIHRLKYKAFYSILREEADGLLTISFDCQKNQALPKLPDQSAYYSRQFSFYHFAIVTGNSKVKLTPNNVYSYYWDDTTHAKGSNEIISAVYHFLQNMNIIDNIKVLRVISDGCSGQNKNTGMISMLSKWLFSESPRHVKRIELIYPVVGHSFIPPDRVFAKIEKVIKTKEVITSPSEYVSVLQEHTKCTDLASIPVYDWKSSYQNIIKPTTSWHFAFMKCKRVFITRTKTENVFVQGEVNYRAENNTKMTITKKNKKITMIQPNIIQPNKIIPNAAKLQDVLKLLKTHFGDNWESLNVLHFYKTVKERAQELPDNMIENPENNDHCALSDLCEPGFTENNSYV